MRPATATEVEGVANVWRIFGVHDDYLSKRSSADTDWHHEVAQWPTRDDATFVYVGHVPKHVIEARRVLSAAFKVTWSGEWRDAADRYAVRDGEIDNELCEGITGREEDRLTTRFGLWVTIELRRSVVLIDSTGSKYEWVDVAQAMELSESFEEEAQRHLDLVGTFVAAGLSHMDLSEAISTSRVVFTAPGKAPCALPRVEAGPVTVSVGRAWSSLPLEELTRTLTLAKQMQLSHAAPVGAAARWLWAAKAVRDDRMRRFFFSFFGIEVLVGRMAATMKHAAIEKLKTKAGPLPFEELIWPKVQDEDANPWRNLVFRFAVMALVLAEDDAGDDTSKFRDCARARNRMAHGGEMDPDTLPDGQCLRLLAKYVPRAAAYLLSRAPESGSSS